MVRQAVWESLETFSAIVNAACEDDLGGEVIYLIIIISSLSSTILTGRSPHHHHCLSLSSWIVWYNVHFRDLFPGVRFDNDRGGRPKPWKEQIQLPGVYCPLLSRTGWVWSLLIIGVKKSDLCERYLSGFWCHACSIHRGFSCSDALLPCHVPHQRVLHHRESSGGQDFLHSLKGAFSLNPGSVGAILVGRGSSLGDSCILHVLTVSRHCHPGWSKDRDKDDEKRFSQLLSPHRWQQPLLWFLAFFKSPALALSPSSASWASFKVIAGKF